MLKWGGIPGRGAWGFVWRTGRAEVGGDGETANGVGREGGEGEGEERVVLGVEGQVVGAAGGEGGAAVSGAGLARGAAAEVDVGQQAGGGVAKREAVADDLGKMLKG